MPTGDQISYFLELLTDAISEDIKLYIASAQEGSPANALKGQVHIFQNMYVKDDSSKVCPAVNICSTTCKYPSTVFYVTKEKNKERGDLYTTIGEEDVKLVLAFHASKSPAGLKLTTWQQVTEGAIEYLSQTEVSKLLPRLEAL